MNSLIIWKLTPIALLISEVDTWRTPVGYCLCSLVVSLINLLWP